MKSPSAPRARRAPLAVLLSLLAWVAVPRPARACDCEFPSVSEAIASADAVVVGRFVSSVRHGRRRAGVVEYRVRVERAWKGAQAGETISLWDTGSSCDTIYGRWRGPRVFFAVRDERGRLVPGHCDQPIFHWRLTTADIARQIDTAPRP